MTFLLHLRVVPHGRDPSFSGRSVDLGRRAWSGNAFVFGLCLGLEGRGAPGQLPVRICVHGGLFLFVDTLQWRDVFWGSGFFHLCPSTPKNTDRNLGQTPKIIWISMYVCDVHAST